MATQRTGGMTVIGILNFVFGGLGCVGSLLMILGGGAFALFGSAMEEAAAAEGMSTEGFSEAAATGGGMFMLLGKDTMSILHNQTSDPFWEINPAGDQRANPLGFFCAHPLELMLDAHEVSVTD